MDHRAVTQWVASYERVWRSPGTDGLAELFTSDATYLTSPWATAIEGLSAIEVFWDAGREGPEEQFTMTSDVLAVEDDTAVVRVAVEYADPASGTWLDLWVLRFAENGRCSSFEEWPIAPPS